LVLVERFKSFFNFLIHCHISALESKVRKILGRSKPAWQENGIEFLNIDSG